MCLGVDKVKLVADEAAVVSLALAKEGKSLREIADEVGYCHEWVRGVLKDHGVKLTYHRRGRKPKLCHYCGNPVEKGQSTRCKSCAEKYRHNQYQFMTEEQKKWHNDQTRKWKRERKKETSNA